MTERIRIALAGNPNCGKSTLFNALTGAHQHTGNWPGKTVEKKEGVCTMDGITIEVVDLPGAYSLTAYSFEEVISRDHILLDKPDVVVCVVDASNLERNLYLTTQILELGVPVVVALNMLDMAEKQGIQIDEAILSQALHSPVVRLVASNGAGIQSLIEAVVRHAGRSFAHSDDSNGSSNGFLYRLRQRSRGRDHQSSTAHCH